jgi:prepilin peptidase CpaA
MLPLHGFLPGLATALTLLSIGVLRVAAWHDVVARTVPNLLPLVLAVAGLGLRAMDGTLLVGVAGAILVFAVAFFCWRRGWMGGGDVKLIGGAALAVSPPLLLTFLLVMSVAGSVLSAIYLIGRSLHHPHRTRRPSAFVLRAARVERWRFHRGGPLPYACAIAAGGLFVLV